MSNWGKIIKKRRISNGVWKFFNCFVIRMISLINKIRIVVVLSGFICMELEIMGTRILSPVFGSTIYVWTSLIGVTLTFLAIGYWYGGRLADKGKININALGLIILLLGFYVCLLPRISRLILPFTSGLDIILGPLLTSFVILSLPVFFLGFIVPVSVKLITKSLEEVGGKAGEIYSLATIGSIIGTFITGFFLVPYLGVAKACLISGLVLILLSLIIIEFKAKFLFLAVIPLLFISKLPSSAKILESYDGYYGQTRIIKNENHLRLYKGVVPQTAINLKTKENEMSYIKYFEIPFIYNSDYKKTLMIGLGGGYTAKELAIKYNLDMDIAEIDRKMLDFAKKYFYWNNEAKVYFDDGRHFVKNSRIYDIIIIDIGCVFPAWHLYTLEAFQEYSRHLNPNGALIINIFSAKEGEYSKLTKTLYKTMEQVYDEVIILRRDIEPDSTQSIALLATKEKVNKNKFISIINNLEYQNPFIKKIISEQYQLDNSIKLTTDNHPLAEFYDYENWQELGAVNKRALEYFLP